jgi:alkanesulfonate monooxygenase SsuD/methylene tetrahydromethanopterin reductase-like flavin-dependent oxidoreductase (luciferase family)
VNGAEPPPVSAAGWVFCDEDSERARELAHTYIGDYYRSVLDHCEPAGGHFAGTKGYEYYGKMSDTINRYGSEEAVRFFVDLNVWGTPDQCYERILDIRSRVGCDRFMGAFAYGGMPYEEAERNLRLFASAVAPRPRAHQPQPTALS